MGVTSDYFSQITRKTTFLKITESKSEIRGGGWVFLGILGGAHGSPNPDPISDQKIFIFHTRFQTWQKTIPVFRPGAGRNYVTIT